MKNFISLIGLGRFHAARLEQKVTQFKQLLGEN